MISLTTAGLVLAVAGFLFVVSSRKNSLQVIGTTMAYIGLWPKVVQDNPGTWHILAVALILMYIGSILAVTSEVGFKPRLLLGTTLVFMGATVALAFA